MTSEMKANSIIVVLIETVIAIIFYNLVVYYKYQEPLALTVVFIFVMAIIIIKVLLRLNIKVV